MVDPVAAFCEVFKYALKFSELPDSERLHAYKILKGKRLQDSFGDLRGLDIEPSDSDDMLDELPYIERMFFYARGIGYIERGTTGEVLNTVVHQELAKEQELRTDKSNKEFKAWLKTCLAENIAGQKFEADRKKIA